MILPDVGVWLAGVWARHVHHEQVASWWAREDDAVVLCRVTQMSLLRLLTNPAVMREDVQTRSSAWAVTDRVMADQRVVWSQESSHLEPVWRSFSARPDTPHKLWTDDYLAAFAQTGGYHLATLDQAMASRYPSVAVTLL